jgi:tetratricopeptide (TPR) repeat protein
MLKSPTVLALICTTALLCPTASGAQDRKIEIRVTGEHGAVNGESPEAARRLALADARLKAVMYAIPQLRSAGEIHALALKSAQLQAFAIALLADAEPAPQEPTGSRVSLQLSLDARDVARRMLELRRDQDAAFELVEASQDIERLYEQLSAESRRHAGASRTEAPGLAQQRDRTLTAIDVRLLTARAYLAFARTDPVTVGGRVSTLEGRERARRLAQDALALDPDSPDVHHLVGDLLVETEQPEDAEAAYRRGLAAEPNSSVARTKLAAALRLQGKFDEALTELREAQRLDANYARAHSDMGMILREQRMVTEAIGAYRAAIAIDPDSIDAHNGLATALAGRGNLEEAAKGFREIVRIDPDSTIGYYNLAYVLADLDRDVESAEALREVVRINPNHYNARYNLGELLRLEQKYDDSAAQFREYLRLAPDTPQNQRNIARARGFIRQFEDPNAPPVAPAMRR